MRTLPKLSDESGQAVIVAALCISVIIAFLGLAIDVGHILYAKRTLQSVADAAALAGALEVRVCGTTPSCPAMTTAAQQALAENNLPGSALITNCSSTAGAGLTLELNNSPCALSSDPNKGKDNYVEAIVSRTEQTYFASILGFNNILVSARAEAARGIGGPCIYALDPTASGAIEVTVALGVVSYCGIVDESNSSSAFSCLAGLLMSAPEINITGGSAGLLCLIHPTPRTGIAPPEPTDPLAYLPPPPTASNGCGSSTGSPYYGSSKQVSVIPILSGIVFYPGVYCGGISITASILGSVTFMPGTYILKDGPGGLLGLGTSGGLQISITALSTITGNGVTFYNEGPTVGQFSIIAPAALGLSTLDLTAPTSGEYGGILFFQAHGVTQSGTFVAALVQPGQISGAIYLPNATVAYGVSALSTSYNILVADQIQFTAPILSTFGNNYSTLQSGSPMNGDISTLVQ